MIWIGIDRLEFNKYIVPQLAIIQTFGDTIK